MRATLIAALLILALVPTAAAASSTLRMELAEGPLQGNTTIPVTIGLHVSDFLCHEPHTFRVMLSSNATEGVKALFEESEVVFQVPARAYFVEPYTETRVVNLSIRALASGSIEGSAMFNATAGPCFVPGGFTATTAAFSREVIANASAAPVDPEPTPTPTPDPTGPDTHSTTNGTTNSTPTPRAPTPTPTSNRSTGVCAPDTTCGPIGDFQPVEESSGERGVPGLGLVALLSVGAVAMFLVRRRRT